jgi:hypothetical protein
MLSAMKSILMRTGMVLGVSGALAACSSSRQDATGDLPDVAAVPVAADQYERTFNAARQVLRDRGFLLERVDAGAGVITTQPKTTAGIVTPWDREQQTFAQELEDLIERQQRVVRITFDAPGQEMQADVAPSTIETPATVAASVASARTMHVQVTVQRVQIPGRKIEPEAISQTSYYWDPVLGDRGMQPSYAVAYKADRLLAERLAGLIAEAASTTAQTPPMSEPVKADGAPTGEPAAAEPKAATDRWVEGKPLQKDAGGNP